jgi:GTP1/Obg family GTP-binding protein
VNEEKNACKAKRKRRKPSIDEREQQKTNIQARSEERNLFKKKSRQLDEKASIEIERARSIQDSHKFYKRLNDVKTSLEAQLLVGPRTVNY